MEVWYFNMSFFSHYIMDLFKRKSIEEKLPETSIFDFYNVLYPWDTHFFHVNDIKIAYTKSGEDTPLLFLHGQGASISEYSFVLKDFADDFKVFAMDFPGFGKSDKPDPAYSVQFYRDLLVSFLDSIGLEKVWLVGHSFGGLIALLFADCHLDKILGMTLAAPGGFYDYSTSAEMFFRNAFSLKAIIETPTDKAIKNYRKISFHHITSEVEEFLSIRRKLLDHKTCEFIQYAKTMIHNLDIVFGEKFVGQQLKFPFPVQLIWGEKDQMLPVSALENAKKSIPDAHVDLIRECGHFPMLEYPDHFVSIVKSYISERLSCE